MADRQQSGLLWQFLRKFIGGIGLAFVPLPFWIFKRQLAGRIDREGTMEFFSHPNFICTMHLIWVGWLMTLGVLYNHFAEEHEFAMINVRVLSWPWITVLLLTLIVMGLQFGRVQIGFLVAAIAVSGLGLALIESMNEDVAIFAAIRNAWIKIDVKTEWGLPLVTSAVLGLLFAAVAAWRRLNDRWSLQATGNYLEHENFQEKDRTISKGAKTFVAVYPCLMRRYLLFGFGDIEVRSSTGEKIIDRIEGVLFARHHAEIIKTRFGTTDTRFADAEEEEAQEDEAAADEAL
ncbi:MAG: hypothetical protein ACE5KM_19310 [Planctomycetaceae bacterium]